MTESKRTFCAKTYRRRAKDIAKSMARDGRTEKLLSLADSYSEDDRKVAESFEAGELFRAFLAEEL